MWDSDDLDLKKGEVVGDRWLVRTKLGEGSFGAVYETVDGKRYINGIKALKLESVNSEEQVLKVEIAVLKSVEAKRASKHVCTLYACGCTDRYNFMVMTLLGQSVQSLRKASPHERFSLNTTVMIAVQCLHAIQELHLAGWLHRDIKPSNFAFGTEPHQRRTVYTFDFGLARFFVFNKHAGMRKPREAAAMRGTLRYCSLNTHREKELGRQDDLISLQYMLVEMVTGHLPWQNIVDMNQVGFSKIEHTKTMFTQIHPTLLQSHMQLMAIPYETSPDYDRFQTALDNTVSPAVRTTLLFDWEIQKALTASVNVEQPPKSSSTNPGGATEGSAFVPTQGSPVKSKSNQSTQRKPKPLANPSKPNK